MQKVFKTDAFLDRDAGLGGGSRAGTDEISSLFYGSKKGCFVDCIGGDDGSEDITCAGPGFSRDRGSIGTGNIVVRNIIDICVIFENSGYDNMGIFPMTCSSWVSFSRDSLSHPLSR